MTTVERVLVVVEDVLLIDFFVVGGHGELRLAAVESVVGLRTVWWRDNRPLLAESSQRDRGGECDRRSFYAENSLAERDGLPAGGCGGGDFSVGQAAFGADCDAGGDWVGKVGFAER